MAGDAADIRKLRHDLANPLGALLTEVQMLLMDDDPARNPETTAALKQIEMLARQMRDMLAATRDAS